MSDYVLDASAVLAVIQEEPGSEQIEAHLKTGCIGTVNLAEVVTKLQERGMTDAHIGEALSILDLDIRPFDAPTAIATGKLRAATRSAGLSLGDRACLALAASLGATALTTDRAWERVNAGVQVVVAR